MSEEHVVRAKFVLDDHAQSTFGHLKKEFGELEEHAKEAAEHVKERFEGIGEHAREMGSEIGSILKTAAGTFLGFEAAGLVESFKSIGEEVFTAAAGMEEQEKAIRGVLMMTDKEGTSLDEMTHQAHELGESFARMGVETGASKTEIISAFDEMAERTGMSTENVEKLTASMAQAGRATTGGIGSLSAGFANMSAGMIRAKNPIVQLIAATGVLHGNAKSVAQQLQKMNPQKAMQLGIDAVEKMSAKMKDTPLSFGESVASLKQLREQIYESLGTPVLNALGPPLQELRGEFMENRAEINKWAEEVGKHAGEWITEAAHEIKDGFHYLEAHSAEIKADIMEGMKFVKDTVMFIIDHREALAMAWGASKVPGIVGAGIGAAKTVGSIGAGALDLGTKLASVSFGGGAATANAAGAAATASSAAAAAGEGAVAAEGAAIKVGAAGVTMASGAAASAIALGSFAAAIGGVGAAVWQGTKLWGDAVTHNGTVLEMRARKLDAEKAAMAGDVDEVERMTTALYNAGQATDAYIAQVTNQAESIHAAIVNAGVQKSMVDVDVRSQASERSDVMASVAYKKAHRGENSEHVTAQPVQNFYGGVHISQDFKNTDPDRVALIFKKALAQSATSKTTAATQTPHTAF